MGIACITLETSPVNCRPSQKWGCKRALQTGNGQVMLYFVCLFLPSCDRSCIPTRVMCSRPSASFLLSFEVERQVCLAVACKAALGLSCTLGILLWPAALVVRTSRRVRISSSIGFCEVGNSEVPVPGRLRSAATCSCARPWTQTPTLAFALCMAFKLRCRLFIFCQ